MVWDSTKPATNAALVSPDVRGNFASIQAALGNMDANPLQVAFGVAFLAGVSFAALPTGIGSTKIARVTADVTKNASTVFGDVTGLSFAIAANETWAFEVRLKQIGTSVANAKYTFTGPAAPTGVMFGVMSGITPTVSNNQAAVAFGTAVDANLPGTSNTEILIMISGCVRNGANAGTVQLQFAQLASEASNLIIRAESFLEATRYA